MISHLINVSDISLGWCPINREYLPLYVISTTGHSCCLPCRGDARCGSRSHTHLPGDKWSECQGRRSFVCSSACPSFTEQNSLRINKSSLPTSLSFQDTVSLRVEIQSERCLCDDLRMCPYPTILPGFQPCALACCMFGCIPSRPRSFYCG